MNETKALLAEFIGLRCWSVVGPSAGSWVRMDFGRRLRRQFSVENSKLRDEQRHFHGEHQLFVMMSCWRLRSEGVLLCDSESSHERVTKALHTLEGKEVTRFDIEISAGFVDMGFSDSTDLTLTRSMHYEAGDIGFKITGKNRGFSVRVDGMIVPTAGTDLAACE